MKILALTKLISSHGGINMGPRPQVFCLLFMKTSDQHIIY